MALSLSFFSTAVPIHRVINCQATTTLSAAAPSISALPINPSPIPPPSLSCALNCSHFQSCSGCIQEYDLHRPVVIDEAITFFNKLGVKDFSFDSCRLWGWRCRAKLAVRGSSTKPLIGLYEEGTHNVVDIPECKAHHPNINAAAELLKRGIIELNVEPYDEDQGTGDLRYVQMAVTTHDTSLPIPERYKNGKVQVSLVWNSRSENSANAGKLNALANFLWGNGGPKRKVHLIHSVWANFQTSSNNIIFGNRWRHLLGERDFWEHIGGIDVSLAPSSFGQANTRAFDSLLRKLQKYVPQGASVVDLYAGAGVIGLSLAFSRKCRKGLDPSLVKELRHVSAIELRTCKRPEKVKDEKRPWILRAREAAIQIESTTACEENQSLPQTLIYISCGWESFKEDCLSLLASKEWRLHKAHGFNFFPGTQSIEILAVFKRGRGASTKKKNSGKKQKRPQ
ncbi:unnamed protein product [Withania somnifera]